TGFALVRHADTSAFARARWNADGAPLAAPVQNALRPLEGLFQGDLDGLFKITPANGLAISFAGACAPTENAGEEIREVGAAALVELHAVRTAGCAARHPIRPVEAAGALAAHALPLLVIGAQLVVFSAFVSVAQDLVGFVDLFEGLLGGLITGVHVRVVLASQFAVRLFDFFFAGVSIHAEDFVVVPILHSPHR